MEFDSADVASMFANGTWTNVILHEMGHISASGRCGMISSLKNGAATISARYAWPNTAR
jgi:hypothetical protein